ncbi:MAG TPA: S-methyl-5-thioribose-1-phosphate isomerase [Anaerolineales bacterium]|nr:S-methyl-5-thioribose-1-phosphate isomerase [Anaerolineales bacterium]
MRSIEWVPDGPAVRMIDQRRLPGRLEFLTLRRPEDVAAAIADMAIRGAPAIGAAAAFGLALAGSRSDAGDSAALWEELESASSILRASRPTAANLGWALERVLRAGRAVIGDGPQAVRQVLVEAAQRLADEDVEINRRIGQHGAALIPDGGTVIHHCNTGALATVDYGTALGVIRSAHEAGKRVHVLVDETRPRLQGSRLTAWELEQYGITYDIISDGAAGYFLRSGKISAVLIGADRVAANGDVANKIGSYMLALAANDNHVPFYCVVPTSTIDLGLPSGESIPIEERDPAEVLHLEVAGERVAPETSQARNPAFDITPNRLLSAFVTEVGVLRPPYPAALASAVERARDS